MQKGRPMKISIRPKTSMTPSVFLTSVLVVLIAIVIGSARPALSSDDEHIFCVFKEPFYVNSASRRVFYTAVFLADYSRPTGYENAFGRHLKDHHRVSGLLDRYCFFERSASDASEALQRRVDDDRRLGLYEGGVILTGWAPDNFSNRNIQDFHVRIPGSSGSLNICVRDHECEDGDEIRVSVENSVVFDGEITNEWSCDRIRVDAGKRYRIDLLAVNGTGRKGPCNYADVNTGEIRVTGDNESTQTWRHRGGAGSRAQIFVEP